MVQAERKPLSKTTMVLPEHGPKKKVESHVP